MARPPTGTIERVPLGDGAISFRGRFIHGGERQRIIFGTDADGWTRPRARRELDDVLAQLKAGIPLQPILDRYRPPEPTASTDDEAAADGISFHQYASEWLARRLTGELGDGPISDATREDYLWRLRGYLLPFFGEMPITAIDVDECRRFRAQLLAERAELVALQKAGAPAPRDARGRPRKPLALRSIQMLIGLLAQLLDDAVEDGLRTDNPARTKRMRVRVPKPRRTFLEIDQLTALLDAIHELQVGPRDRSRAKLTVEQVAVIRGRLEMGETQTALRREFGMSASATSLLANGKTYRVDGSARVGWRTLGDTLGYAGLRINEALTLRERDVRLHDPAGARLWVSDSKTETGVRYVEITPTLLESLIAHREAKQRHGYPCGPDDYVFCTRTGQRWNASNVRSGILAPAAARASERLVANGLPPLPHVTPHTLRRTYVSIMLLATDFDVPFVQHQVGHADSKMTMDVYAQLLDRSKRDHGAAFDQLVATARDTLDVARSAGFSPSFSPLSPKRVRGHSVPESSTPLHQRDSGHGRGWFRTSDLSRVRRALSR